MSLTGKILTHTKYPNQNILTKIITYVNILKIRRFKLKSNNDCYILIFKSMTAFIYLNLKSVYCILYIVHCSMQSLI